MDLNKMPPEELGKIFPIYLTPPNDKWVTLYQEAKHRLFKKFKDRTIVAVHHVGSTAIPNIMAKPTIDILLEMDPEANKGNFIDKMKEEGYDYIPRKENPPPHMMFAKGYSIDGFKGQTYHVHVRYPGNYDEVYFRDYLIEHPEIAKEYESLKISLAKEHKNHRENYTDGKTEFVKEVLKKAKHEIN
jgi:GrpB-like predicted nucleotidyltransferase (UPF0157 family)